MRSLPTHAPLERQWRLVLSVLCAISAGCAQTADWRDSSEHTQRFVEAEPSVRIEVLDWGGSGPAVVLLAGHGDTGHVFDEFAPSLAGAFRVLAITRRGFGSSDQPRHGYDLATMTKDIITALDVLKVHCVHVLGHSIAGDEMLRLARDYLGRIDKLVFLEAGYDRVLARDTEAKFPKIPPATGPTPADLASPAALRAFVARTVIAMPESEIRATRVLGPDGRFVRSVTPDEILNGVARMVERPDYRSLRVPALAIYAVPTDPGQLIPRFWTADTETRNAIEKVFEIWNPAAKAQREYFRQQVPHARVVEIQGASHYVFISHRDRVLREVSAFSRSVDPRPAHHPVEAPQMRCS